MVNVEHELTLSFDDANIAEAGRFAAELANRLRQAEPPIQVEERRINKDAQDPGSTLVLLLGAPAVVALAKGVATWLAMRPDAKVTIKDKDGSIIASGLRSSDARAIIEVRIRGGR
jgi:hypothetical protein